MSPNGLKAPPALAATTILIQATAINLWLSPATAITTVAISNAVVKLSATGEMKNAIKPVSQKMVLNEKPLLTNQARIASKMPRSPMVLM